MASSIPEPRQEQHVAPGSKWRERSSGNASSGKDPQKKIPLVQKARHPAYYYPAEQPKQENGQHYYSEKPKGTMKRSQQNSADPDDPMITSLIRKQWIFRDPAADDPLEIALQFKSMALSNISNTQQTFTMTVMEDVAVWITREEFEAFCRCPDKQDFKPHHFVNTYVYNSSETQWHEPHRTLEGSPYHIRDIFGDNKCWAFRQRQGKIVFHSPFDLHNFPFDVQDLTCKFALYTYSNCSTVKRVLVRPMYGGTTFSRLFVDPNDEYKVHREHRTFFESKGYVCCTYKFSREWIYYFWKVMVVLSIVTLTSLASFVSFGSYLEQITHLSTVLLTDMAYLFTIQSHMPTLRYLTLLDWWVFGNIFYVFVMFMEVTLIEKLEIDMEQRPGGQDGLRLMSIVFLANLACWAILVFIFVMIAVRARQKERKKLGNPAKEDDWMKEEHEPFECNLFGGGSDMALMLG
ncbi:expressed unknown protein [Seminavis robusta]|uniref:Uncharacterized protein n=1 Tax=Seminavis robusta TaxID=568900 RepID=A0A9N8ED90_9STRA|nr:expressed unknown protein [Seminavis robusta]|eukprot:Sro774_g200660.1 n/a (462) ;mRNA; f:26471-27856